MFTIKTCSILASVVKIYKSVLFSLLVKTFKIIQTYWQLVLFPSQMAGEFICGGMLCRVV
jgi:hypothetical protein